MDWRRLFPDSDFRHPMALRPGDAAAFFKFTSSDVFQERMYWFDIEETSKCCVAAEATALGAILEFAGEFKHVFVPGIEWRDFNFDAQKLAWGLGALHEPDWVLLRADNKGNHRLIAGAVCFPSGWSLAEKNGQDHPMKSTPSCPD